jgi:hypothetical protein
LLPAAKQANCCDPEQPSYRFFAFFVGPFRAFFAAFFAGFFAAFFVAISDLRPAQYTLRDSVLPSDVMRDAIKIGKHCQPVNPGGHKLGPKKRKICAV